MLDAVATPADYLYLPAWPEGCQGKRYRAHRFVVAVPSYQRQVLVEAIDGPDAGLWFVCSLNNFLCRYEPAPEEPATEPAGVPEKAAGYAAEDWRAGA